MLIFGEMQVGNSAMHFSLEKNVRHPDGIIPALRPAERDAENRSAVDDADVWDADIVLLAPRRCCGKSRKKLPRP